MNPAVSRLICLRQGDRSIEEYVEDFCGLCYQVDFNDVALKDFFRFGLNEPISSSLPGGKICWSLEEYIDHALLLSGSPYTVGIVDEGPRNPAVTTTPQPVHVMPAKPKPVQATSTKPKPAHAMPAAPGPAHAMPAAPGPAHAMPAAPGPAHATPGPAATPESAPRWPPPRQSLHARWPPSPNLFTRWLPFQSQSTKWPPSQSHSTK
ncbi:Protein piccolo [Labeo rohita]|uniref:Protein piccolo n=1 Tax=Labeo rohita TaxID=84645 RepID=A0ABQ8M5R8_LABRO|nr:Protein piccolo [Labeo rohita]